MGKKNKKKQSVKRLKNTKKGRKTIRTVKQSKKAKKSRTYRKPHGTVPINRSFRFGKQRASGKPIEPRETYIMDITSNADDQFIKVPINIGLKNTFPWASILAQGFEKYTFVHLAFHFITNRPATDSGMIAMMPDYDPDDDNSRLEKRELLTFDGVEREKIWDNMTMTIDLRKLNTYKDYFIRDVDLPDTEKKLYDPMQLNVFVDTPDIPSGSLLGELWVSYIVDFKIPQLQRPLPRMYVTQSANTSTDPFSGSSNWLTGSSEVINDMRGALSVLSGGLKVVRDIKALVTVYGESQSFFDPTLKQYGISNVSKIDPSGGSVTITDLSDSAISVLDTTGTSVLEEENNFIFSVDGAASDDPATIFGTQIYNSTDNNAPLADYTTVIQELSDREYQRLLDLTIIRRKFKEKCRKIRNTVKSKIDKVVTKVKTELKDKVKTISRHVTIKSPGVSYKDKICDKCHKVVGTTKECLLLSGDDILMHNMDIEY